MLGFHAIPVLEGSPPLDGVHLQWSPTIAGCHAADGFSIWRRRTEYRPGRSCESLEDNQLNQLHQNRWLDFVSGEVFFTAEHKDWAEWSARFLETAVLSQKGGRRPVPYQLCLYHFRFEELRFGVDMQFQLPARTPFALVVAMRTGKVVEVKTVFNTINFNLEQPADEVRVYLSSPATRIQICHEDWTKNRDKGWELLERNLQLPFSEVNTAVANAADGWQLVKSRLLVGENPGNGDFTKLSNLLNEAFRAAKKSRLPVSSMLVAADSEPADPATGRTTPFHFSPWNWLLGLTIRPAWRRALGFAWQDTIARGLVPGQLYDYKIAANFPRKALGERTLDFRSVPLHTRVGPGFSLRDVFFYTDPSTEVTAFPPQAESGGYLIYQKGVQVVSHLHLYFPQPVNRLALFCAPNASEPIDVPALNLRLIPSERIDLPLPVPVTHLLLKGKFALLGVAFPAIPAGEDPEKLVETAQYIFNVRFQNTPRLLAPPTLTAENLQKQWLPNTRQVPEGLGFRLQWPLPSVAGGAILPELWPPDCPAPPPLEINHFTLEHWDKTLFPGGAAHWEYYDHDEPDNSEGMVVPYRGTASEPPLQMVFGADLLAVFPPEKSVLNDFSILQKLSHVLRSPGRPSKTQPGSKHRYRIWSVDAVGRSSATATESADVILEKRQAPPPPTGIETILENIPHDLGNTLPDPRTDSRPKSVYVRVLQASDPYLTDAERQFLDIRDRATILTWGWGDEERRLDPWVREFRVYWRGKEFGRILGNWTGTPVAAGANWRIGATFSEAVGLDEFVGKYIYLNRIPFRVLHHPAGLSGQLEIAPPASLPGAVPQPGNFEFFRKMTGSESRPTNWDERIAVVPLGQQQVYQYLLETGELLAPIPISVGTAGQYFDVEAVGSAVRGWLGVSAADGENYIADQVDASANLGGRAGNESGIVAAQVQAEYFGRPEFVPPPLLDEPPVELLDEVRSEELLLPLRPADDFDPGLFNGHKLRLERISAAAVLSLLQITATDVAVVSADDATVAVVWDLAPADEAELRQQMARGSQFVSNKFFWTIATSSLFSTEKLWQAVVPQPVDYHETITDRLPNNAERYIYRVRVADATGRVSAAGAPFPRVWRSPDKTLPPMPSITDLRFRKYETPTLRAVFSLKIQIQAAVSSTTKGILVFAAIQPGVGNSEAARQQLSQSRMAKIPNRPDLAPEVRTRLSLPDGRLMEPIFLPKSAAAVVASSKTSVLVWDNVEMDVQYESLGGVWAAAVSDDNILSPLTSPRFMAIGKADEV